ncbi:hypothetical protein [Spirillospora sp. NPDC047279]|uniref:hypothetical protein n=1 Tax=Spirillospora sp. NPDC047279 TaxID=3155478 RepID=UPI00340C3CAF
MATLGRPSRPSSHPFSIADRPLSLNDLRSAPADPQGIVAWARRTATRDFTPEALKRENDVESFVNDFLFGLLAQAPASPRTRAAAFRALATSPGITSGDIVRDSRGRKGRELRLGPLHRFVVDPATATLLAESVGSPGLGRSRTRTHLEAGWTNERPAPSAEP